MDGQGNNLKYCELVWWKATPLYRSKTRFDTRRIKAQQLLRLLDFRVILGSLTIISFVPFVTFVVTYSSCLKTRNQIND